MIEKWVNFKRDYLEISFLREKWVCAISPYHRRYVCNDIPTTYISECRQYVPLLQCVQKNPQSQIQAPQVVKLSYFI